MALRLRCKIMLPGALMMESSLLNWTVMRGLDRRIGHLASMSPQKNERLTPIKG